MTYEAAWTDLLASREKEHLNELQSDKDILVLTGPKKMDFVVSYFCKSADGSGATAKQGS